MKLLQHAYGRVSRGFQGSTPGHQVAGLSSELAGQKDVIERLNKLSFYRYRGRDSSSPARFSFFRASRDWLSLGCVRMSRDLTGAAALFAHHFLWQETDFLRSDLSPIQLLQTLPFMGSESELPEDRVLPAINIDTSPDNLKFSDEWQQKALGILASLLDADQLGVPMVILPDPDMWQFLAHLFRLLPRQEAARTGFSSLFTQSTELLDAFRLVFVPDKTYIPSMAHAFDLYFPEDLLSTPKKPHELAIFWQRHPGQGDELVSFINQLRHTTSAPDDLLSCLKSLLGTGSDFRKVIERFQVEGILPLILEDPAVFEEYWRTGPGISYKTLHDTLWEKPQQRLNVILTFTQNAQANVLRDDILLDIGQEIDKSTARGLFGVVHNAGLAREFFSVIGKRMDIRRIMELAEHLAAVPAYAGELQRFVAGELLQNRIQQGVKETWDWLRRNHEPDKLARAAAAFHDSLSGLLPGFLLLADFQLDLHGYELLARWAVGKGVSPGIPIDKYINSLFDPRYRRQFFYLIVEAMEQMSTELAGDCLEFVIEVCRPQTPEYERLIEVIRIRHDSRRLAARFLQALEKTGGIDSHIHQQLQDLAERKGIGNFFSGLFKK